MDLQATPHVNGESLKLDTTYDWSKIEESPPGIEVRVVDLLSLAALNISADIPNTS